MTQTAIQPRSRDGYDEAKDLARDNICGGCGADFVVRFDNTQRQFGAFCPKGCAGAGLKLRHQQHADEIRERLEQDPRLQQSLAISGARVPMTTNAIKELDNEKLLARIPARYGTSDSMVVSKEQRLAIAQLARLYGLDPLTDLMVYECRSYVTYDGRLRKLREHPDFRGYRVRPMLKDEKEAWGYDAADIVIICDADMGPRGVITDYGVVRRSEIDGALEKARQSGRQSAPVAKHPQQIALKRAVSRTSRVAAGIDLPTMVDATHQVIEIVPEAPVRRALAGDQEARERARFWATARGPEPDGMGLTDEQVHGLLRVQTLSGYPGGWSKALSDLTEALITDQTGESGWTVEDSADSAFEPSDDAPEVEPAAPAEMVTHPSHPRYQALSLMVEEAARLDVEPKAYTVNLPCPLEEIETKLHDLKNEVTAKKLALATPRATAEQGEF